MSLLKELQKINSAYNCEFEIIAAFLKATFQKLGYVAFCQMSECAFDYALFIVFRSARARLLLRRDLPDFISMDDCIQTISKPMNYSVFSDAVFSGIIFCVEDNQYIRNIVDEAQQILCETFTPFDPELAHIHYDSEECRNRFGAAQTKYKESQTVFENFMGALKFAGIHPDSGFRDKLMLRMALPNAAGSQKGGVGTLLPHRESWGSGIRCQINWWFPVLPLTPERTMAIYPDYWSVRLENDARDWDWKQNKNERSRKLLPTAIGAIDGPNRICMMPDLGEAIAFSGAHLHASVLNTTDKTRFPSESRTVSIRDITKDGGATSMACAPSGL